MAGTPRAMSDERWPEARGRGARAQGQRAARFPQWIVNEARGRGVDYGQILVAAESHFSCLMPYQMGQVAAIYAAEVGAPPATILDATANVGCDTIQFCRMYPAAAVTSVEIDPGIAALLRHNMARLPSVLGRRVDRPVAVLNGDGVELLLAEGPQVDLVYFDPPWGGPEYYKSPLVRLTLNGRPLGDIVGAALALGKAGLAVVKAPANADMAEFLAAVAARAERGAKATVTSSAHEILKPKGNRRGAVAYRLVFVRAGLRPAPA